MPKKKKKRKRNLIEKMKIEPFFSSV
jgi:hypothetical protein